MRFSVRKIGKRKDGRDWTIQFRTYKRDEILKKNGVEHKSQELTRTIPTNEWSRYGFDINMTIQEARERVKQLNALKDIEDQKIAQIRRLDRLKKEEAIDTAFLPRILVTPRKLFLVSNNEEDEIDEAA